MIAPVPEGAGLRELASAARACRACELFAEATQTVFGIGAVSSRVLLVGEAPGDVEDKRGAPFVGPAGRLLDRALLDAGLRRDSVYLTNAVKHFRWKSVAGGKRRIHKKPDATHLRACRPWLAAEIAAVRPQAVVLLGASAAAAVLGSGFRLTEHRGQLLPWPADSAIGKETGEVAIQAVIATIHPSAVLRAGHSRRDMYRGLVDDLALAKQVAVADQLTGQPAAARLAERR